ncbi:undecaprenyl-phosphate glucose phosphotransferase [Gemmata sp.]|uniref:undecaprenyl-phosphate glucose phosphotransferase n=1 Tax=Gemmata sp. TaxID=1914242 RepID=UPI003F6E7C02
MIRRTSQTLTIWFVAWDVALTAVAWLASYWVRFGSGLFAPDPDAPQPPFERYVGNLPLVAILAAVTYRFAGMYEIHRLRRFREELVAVGKGVGLMALVVMATSFARQNHYESRLAMAAFVGTALVSVVFTRRMSWKAVRLLRANGVNQSRALVVGSGRLARRTVRTLRAVSWSGIKPVGYVEDDAHRAAATDLPVLGDIGDLRELVAKYNIHHVFVALPLNRYGLARRVFAELSQVVVDVQLVADVPQIAGMAFHTTHLHGMTVVGLRESPHHGLNVVVKRFMDMLLATVALAVLAPVMGLIAALIKITSPGPVFYRQERCGLNGEPFNMLKFRTMRADAEKNGPQMTAVNDPRKTWLGAVLRATNLDELPQLFNVLRGDMSLVGPRPERPVFVNQFSKTIPGYMARHAVKAGMTGWAQVNGWRGNSSLRRRVQFDLYYITHWNPVFDLRIMFLTVWRMLFQKQKHAY